MNMEPKVDISIVVACRNEAPHIARFLDSLLDQEMEGLAWEAIIAEGMSSDGTRAIIEDYARRDSRVVLVDNPGRIVSTGLNRAILAARGQVILRMDAHTEYDPSYCRCSLETLTRTGADNVGGPARTRAATRAGRAIAAAYHSRFSTGGARFHDENFEGWVDTVPYGCWHKATLLELGLFDEDLVRNQDDEMNLRLVRSGGRIWQNPRIVSWYWPRPTLGSLFRQQLQYGFWKVAVIRKHRLPASWRHLVPAVFVAANVLLPAGAAVSALAGQGPGACGALWLAMLAAYLTATLAASAMAARRHGWDLFILLPAVFAVYHCAYGAGFLSGLVSGTGRNPRRRSGLPLFTRVTR
jgi:GT2 family glycosyltransferase